MSVEIMKIVINECEGYFDLSKEAYERYLELNPSFDSYNLDAQSIKRTDKSLIKVVKELGSAANTNHSKLKIDSIPCGALYSIVDNGKGIEDLDVYSLDNWCIATKDGEVELKDICIEACEDTKSAAYKECLTKVKNYIKTHCNPYGKPDFDYDTSIKILNFIDNFVKGMTEVETNQRKEDENNGVHI